MSQLPAPPPRPLLIVLAYVGFVSLGLPDAVIGVAWPSVREAFALPQGALGLVLVASGGGYFVSSFFTGRLVRGLGIGLLLAASTGLVAAAAGGYAVAPVWVAFAACAVVHGLGSGAIDAGLNGYAAAHLSARHMNWLHACYCFGAMLGPIVMTGVLTAGGTYRHGYGWIAGALFALALAFTATRTLWGTADPPPDAGRGGTWAALRQPTVRLQMVLFFCYTGLEVTVGQWTFTLLTESRGVDAAVAGVWVGAYWGSIGFGRVLLGFVVERVGVDRLFCFCLPTAGIGTALIALQVGEPIAYLGLVLVGLGLAPVYPGLMTRTPQRLGPALAAHAVGFQVGAAMIGVAVLPAAVGATVESFGLEAIGPAALALAVLAWLLHELLVWHSGKTSRSGSDAS